MNKRFNYPHTYKKLKSRNEVLRGESLTVPDMTHTLRELAERHVRGIGLPLISISGVYDDTEDPEEYNPLRDPDVDLSDAVNMKNELSELKKKGVGKEKAEPTQQASKKGNDDKEGTNAKE